MLKSMLLVLVLVFAVSLALADTPAISHSFLVTGGETYIVMYESPQDATGKVVWRYPVGTRDGYVLPNGNVLLAVNKTNEYPGGAVVEVTRDSKVTLKFKGTQSEVNSAQPVENGGVVLTEAGPKPRLIELDASGKTVVEFPLQCQLANHHMQTRMARKLPDGTYLVPHLFDFAVKQYDKTGKVLKVIDTSVPGDTKRDIHSWPFTAIRLPNGNTLCGLTHSNRVAEFSAEGKIVWQLTNDDLPAEHKMQDSCGVQRLPNGNTVITAYAAKPGQTRLIEVTPDKKVVWTHANANPHGIHHFQILDTNAKPLEGTPMK